MDGRRDVEAAVLATRIEQPGIEAGGSDALGLLSELVMPPAFPDMNIFPLGWRLEILPGPLVALERPLGRTVDSCHGPLNLE